MLGQIWDTVLFAPIHNLLVYLYVVTGSLGVSVILIIIIVRLLLTPMVIKQYADMKKLSSIRPRLQELQEKYKGDPQRLAQAQSELYKEIGYNPLGCFVNIFVQFPVIIALYQSVITFTQHTPQTMPGLYPFVQDALLKLGQSTFSTNLFGILLMENPLKFLVNFNDIATSIPYVILLVILGISNFVPTYINMKYINPQTLSPAKKKSPEEEESFEETFSKSMSTSTLYVMPILITVSMVSLQSIISVYLIFQNIIGVIQQVVVKFYYDKRNKK